MKFFMLIGDKTGNDNGLGILNNICGIREISARSVAYIIGYLCVVDA